MDTKQDVKGAGFSVAQWSSLAAPILDRFPDYIHKRLGGDWELLRAAVLGGSAWAAHALAWKGVTVMNAARAWNRAEEKAAFHDAADRLVQAWDAYLRQAVDPAPVLALFEKQMWLARSDEVLRKLAETEQKWLRAWAARAETQSAALRAQFAADPSPAARWAAMKDVQLLANMVPVFGMFGNLYMREVSASSLASLLDCWPLLAQDALFADDEAGRALLVDLRWLSSTTERAAPLLTVAKYNVYSGQSALLFPSPLVAGLPFPSESKAPASVPVANAGPDETPFFDRWMSGDKKSDELDDQAPNAEAIFALWLESGTLKLYVPYPALDPDSNPDSALRADLRALRSNLKRFESDYLSMKTQQIKQHTTLPSVLASMVARFGGRATGWKAQWDRRAGGVRELEPESESESDRVHRVHVITRASASPYDIQRIIRLAKQHQYEFDGSGVALAVVPGDSQQVGEQKLFFYPKANKPRQADVRGRRFVADAKRLRAVKSAIYQM
jgi:hypothetical protein